MKFRGDMPLFTWEEYMIHIFLIKKWRFTEICLPLVSPSPKFGMVFILSAPELDLYRQLLYYYRTTII